MARESWSLSDNDLTARQAQAATSSGLPPVPGRPTLSIALVQEPIRQVLNAERGSDLGIELVPADDFAARLLPSRYKPLAFCLMAAIA